MMRALALVVGALGVSACVDGGPLVQEATRAMARSAVDTTANRYLPGIPVKPYTDCVINNATTGELLQLADAARGDAQTVAANAWPVVQRVVTRPDARDCLVQAATSSLGPAARGLPT